MSDEDEYEGLDALHTLASEAETPPYRLSKQPSAKRLLTAKLGGIAVDSWPLSTETVAALTTKYSGRVPANNVILRGLSIAGQTRFYDSNIFNDMNPERCREGWSFELTLAHFAIDLTGDASTLTPTSRPPPHTFATVVYFFPSTCVGGAVTISYDHWTTTFEALDGCFLSFYSPCGVTVAPITSGHRSFAVYHAAFVDGWCHYGDLALDAPLPCCLYKPDVERHPTAKLCGIAVDSWPLSTETVAALTTKYFDRIPAKDVIFCGFHDIADREYTFESPILGQLDEKQDDDDENETFSMMLAHFAIDTTGTASVLRPATRRLPPNTFATVVYFFPSNCVGGAVTITHDHRTTTFEALEGCFLSFYNTCKVTVAPITSGHRSVAVYHAAFDIDDCDLEDYDGGEWKVPELNYAPPPLPLTHELQDAARDFDPRHRRNCATIKLETRSMTPTFDSLTGHDKAVVDVLLAANVFDMILVRMGQGANNKYIPEAFHPMCKTPALICHQTPIEKFVFANEDTAPGCYLFFWPKVTRVHIHGYDRTIALLRANIDGDVNDDLGYGSLHCIFEAAFRFFYPQPQHDDGREPTQVTSKMASLLYDHGDLHLIETFLDVHDQWADDETMANWILAVLRRFGAPRIQDRLQTVKASSAFVARLVHLATTGDALAQTIACDCIPLWWPRLLRHLTSSRRWTEKKEGTLRHVFDIDTYMLEHPMDVAAATYLGQHLPDVVVRRVAAYLVPPLASLLQAIRGNKDCVGYLPVILWRRRSSLCRVRLATYIALAVEYLRSGAERTDGCDVLYLALLTAGTPAFAVVDADVQTRRRWFDFYDECTAIDKTTLTPMQALVLEEYLRHPTYGCR